MPYTSPWPDLAIPSVDVFSFIFEQPRKAFADSLEILVDAETSRSYTFGHARDTSVEFGKALLDRWRWRKGQVICVFAPNCVDVPTVIWGALWAGAVVSTANPLYTADELAHQLADSGVRALVTTRPFLDTAREAAARCGIPDNRILLVGDEKDESGRVAHFRSMQNLNPFAPYRKAKIDPKKDIAFLVYSSGTTGLPKGVMVTHHNVVTNVLQMLAVESFLSPGGDGKPQDKQLAVLPFFHIYGLVCIILMSTYRGIAAYVMPRFGIEKACAYIERYRITYAYVPPPVVLAFGKHPAVDKYDLSSLRALTCAAAPLTKDLVQGVWDRLKLPVKQGFGMSEASPGTHVQTPDEWDKHMGSVGKLLPNMKAMIVDEHGKEVPLGEPGELWFSGPNIFAGYLNQPALTAASMTADGEYYKSGDVGYRDVHGHYYITDRLKELIKYKGFQVAPAELEGLLLAHPDVVDSCVVGVPDAGQATELPRAYVVLRTGVPAKGGDEERQRAGEIGSWLAQRVAPHKKLRGGVRFVAEVPKTASGKILRRVIKEQIKKEEAEAKAKL